MPISNGVIIDKEKLIALAEDNMRHKLHYIAKNHPDMSVSSANQTLMVDCGMPSDTFNTAYGGDICPETTKSVFDYYHAKSFPAAWWLGPSSASENANANLAAAGFEHDEYDVGMACDLSQVKTPSKNQDKLDIKSCKTEQEFADFGQVLASIFDPVDEAVKSYYANILKVADDKRTDMQLFVGYENDVPVATSGLFLTEVAGIYDISTRPEKRCNGFGTIMFHHALLAAKDMGCEVSTLQASPDGLGIYKKLGFFEICEFNVWSNANALA